jgi:CheY-like chemotaxis protein
LTVADTGHGMDAGILARIFEPFFTTKPVGIGTGLGLAMVQGIVRAHAGSITVESAVGQGTTFRIYFPAQVAAAKPADEAAPELPLGRGQKILLVDDEPAITKSLELILVQLNYQVVASNDAHEACAIFQMDPAQFDVVLTDLTMPEMNGLELAHKLHDWHPTVPIILNTGYAGELEPGSLTSVGISNLLEKPVSMLALAEMLRDLLNQPGRKPE